MGSNIKIQHDPTEHDMIRYAELEHELIEQDFDGQKVQGTWERDFAEKLTKLGIEWRKCAGKKDVVWYTLDGKQKAYTPDFYLPAIDVYFELKGYWWGRDKEKMDAVFTQHPNIKIAVILKKEFEYIMSLAVTASGWSRES